MTIKFETDRPTDFHDDVVVSSPEVNGHPWSVQNRGGGFVYATFESARYDGKEIQIIISETDGSSSSEVAISFYEDIKDEDMAEHAYEHVLNYIETEM